MMMYKKCQRSHMQVKWVLDLCYGLYKTRFDIGYRGIRQGGDCCGMWLILRLKGVGKTSIVGKGGEISS